MSPENSLLKTSLELEPHLEGALTRRLERASADVVNEPESAGELAVRAGGRRKDVGPRRVLQLSTVEDILEVHPRRERHRFAEFEDSRVLRLFVDAGARIGSPLA